MQGVETPTPAKRALPHGFPKRVWLQAGLHTHGECLCQGCAHDVSRQVVHQLRNRTGTDGTDIAGGVAHGIQYRLILVEGRFVAADPDRHFAALGAVGPAADRCIHHFNALLLHRRVEAAHHGRRVRAEIEIGAALVEPRRQAVFPEDDGLDFGRPRERCEDDIALRRHFLGRGRPLGTNVQMRIGGVAIDVVDDKRILTFDGIEGDTGTHGTETDKSDFHDELPKTSSITRSKLGRSAGSATVRVRDARTPVRPR